MTPLEIRFRAAAVAARKAYARSGAESDAGSDAGSDAEIDARADAVSASPAPSLVNKARKRKEPKNAHSVCDERAA